MPNPHFPACHIKLPPHTEGRRAAFYLAAEEYIAHRLPEGSYLFSWQLRPTVVMGRNQVAHQEVDLDFCQRHHIDVIRRKSGGGAIFADGNNIMWSLITGAGAVEPLFAEYATSVSEALRQLGAHTEVSGRNDIVLAGGGKICGNAFYHLPGRNIVHGTMLYDTDPTLMQGALHPNVDKLQAKGVKSVRSRIGLLKSCLDCGVSELRRRLQDLLCDREIALTDDDVRAIEEIERGYYEPAYLYGLSASGEVVRGGRIEGCGTLNLHIDLQGSLIRGVRLTGDFFELADANEAFSQALCGIPFTLAAIQRAINEHHPERSVRHLTAEALCRLLEGEQA